MTQPNILTEEDRAAGWRLLFNGHSLDGWRGYRLPEGQIPPRWSVSDGAIRVTADDDRGEGDLITVETFGDFELELEWTCPVRGNSGIMYRVTEDASDPYMSGPEYQILDDDFHRARWQERGKTMPQIYATAGCYGMYGPPEDMRFDYDAWNHARIVVRGNHVEHYLNGRLAVRYELHSDDWNQRIKGTKFEQWPGFARAARGHLALQDHGHNHAFRNIRIRPL